MNGKQSRYFVVAMVALSIVLSTIIGCRQIWAEAEEVPPTPTDKQPVSSITITGPAVVQVGATIALDATVSPSNAEQVVAWSSSRTANATVDTSGTVTGVAVGYTDIEATATDTSGISALHRVSVVDEHTEIDETTSLALRAHDFRITLAEANAPLSEAEAITKAGALAWALDVGSSAALSIDATELTAIQTATVVNRYPLTFSATHSASGATLTKTIQVTVADRNTVIGENYALYGKSFTTDVPTAVALTASDIILPAHADARAWKLDDPTAPATVVVGDISALASAVDGKVYPVILHVQEESTTKRTIYITVDGDNTVVPAGAEYGIYGEDFEVDLAELPVTNDKVITEASAKAWKLFDGTPALFTTDAAQLNGAVSVGSYPVTFQVDAEPTTERTVQATVSDKYTKIEPSDDLGIRGKGFVITLSEATAPLTEADAISKAEAHAWRLSDGLAINPITIPDLTNVTGATEGGDVFITLSATDTGSGKTITKQVAVTIEDKTTKVVPADNMAMQAKGFVITLSEANAPFGEADAISKSAAHAWWIDTGLAINPVAVTNLSDVTGASEGGKYSLNYQATDAATSTSIDKDAPVTITDDNTKAIESDNLAIRAYDFTIELSKVSTLALTGVNGVIERARASAWTVVTGEDLTTAISDGPINTLANLQTVGSTGGYSLDLTVTHPVSGATLTRTIQVTVTDNNTEVGAAHAVHAKDFTITADEVAGLTDAIVTTKSEARAWSRVNGAAALFTLDYTEVQTDADDYSATVTVDDDTSVKRTITITVIPGALSPSESEVAVTDNGATVGGNNVIEVTLKDSHGNVITSVPAGTTVDFAATADVDLGSGVGIAHSVTLSSSDPNPYALNVTSTKAGNYTTAVEINGIAVPASQGSPASYNFVAGGVTASESEVAVTINGATVGGNNVLEVTLKDSHGNVITSVPAGTVVDFAATADVDLGSGVGIAHSVTLGSSDPNPYVLNVTSDTVGITDYSTAVEINGTAVPVSQGNPAEYNFVAGGVSASSSEVLVTDNGATVGGNNVIEVTLKDSLGNQLTDVSGITLNFALTTDVDLGSGVGSAHSVTLSSSDPNPYALNVTSTKAGNYTTAVEINGIAVPASQGNPASYNFVAGGVSPSKSEVSLITTNPQDVADKHTLEVTLKDSHGNTITSVPAGTTVNFAATADVAIGTATTGSAYNHTATSGTFRVDLTSTKAGGYSTAVTMGTAPATALTNSPVSYSFIDGNTSTGPDTGGGGDPSDHDLALRAKDFIIDITSGDSPLASGDAAVIAVAEASAWVLEDSRTITPSVSPSPSTLVGVTTSAYEDITFTAEHPDDSAVTISKTIRGTVVGDDAVIEPADDLLLAATSFKLPLYKASSLVLGTVGSGGIVDKASAGAWSLSGEGTVAITIADAAELTAIQQAAQAGGGGAKDYTLTLKATHSESGKTITKAITVQLFDMQATLPTEIYTGQEIEVTTTIASGGFLSFSDITWTVDTTIDTGNMSATLNTTTGKLTLKGITAGEVGIQATGPADAEWSYGNIRVHKTTLNALEDGTGTSTSASNFVAKDKTITLQVTGDFQTDPEVTWSVAPVSGPPISIAVTLTEDTTDQTKATLRGTGEGKVRVTATINGVDKTHDVTVYQLGGTIANMVVGEVRTLMPSSTAQTPPTVVLPLTPQNVETSGGLDIDDIVWSVKAGSVGVVSFLGTPEDKEGKITLEAVDEGDITLVATGPGKGEWEYDFTIRDNGVEIGGGGDGSGGGTDGDSDGDGLVDNADLVAQGKSITLGVQGMSTITSIEWKVETPAGGSGAANFAGSTTSTSNTPTLTGTAAGEVEVILTINGITAEGITLSNYTLPVHTVTVYDMSVLVSSMVEGTTSAAITPALDFGTSGNTPVATGDLNWTPDTASWVLATGEAATVTELANGDIEITAHYEAASTTIEATGPGKGSWSFSVTVTDNGTEIGGGGDGSGGGTDGDSDGDGVADNADLVAVGGAITLGVQGMSTITSIAWKVETPAGGSGAANFAGSNTSNSNTPTLTGTAVGEVAVTVTLSGTTSANEAITNFILQHQVAIYTMTAAIPNPLLVVLSPETVAPVIAKPAGSWVTIADLTWSEKAGNVADVSVTKESDNSLKITSGPTLGAATIVAKGPGNGEWEFDTTVDDVVIKRTGTSLMATETVLPVSGSTTLQVETALAGTPLTGYTWSIAADPDSTGTAIHTNTGAVSAGATHGTVTIEATNGSITRQHTIKVVDLVVTGAKWVESTESIDLNATIKPTVAGLSSSTYTWSIATADQPSLTVESTSGTNNNTVTLKGQATLKLDVPVNVSVTVGTGGTGTTTAVLTQSYQVDVVDLVFIAPNPLPSNLSAGATATLFEVGIRPQPGVGETLDVPAGKTVSWSQTPSAPSEKLSITPQTDTTKADIAGVVVHDDVVITATYGAGVEDITVNHRVDVVGAPLVLEYTLSGAVSNFRLPLRTSGTNKYNLTIDWGDGAVTTVTEASQAVHNYNSGGPKTVTISGDLRFGDIDGDGTDDGSWGETANGQYNSNDYLTGIKSFGSVKFINNPHTFAFVEKDFTLPTDPTDVPHLEGSMNRMFCRATNFNQDVSSWDVSLVTDMSYMFYFAENFNQDVSGWDVSGVTDMGWMFAYATAFNNGGAAGSGGSHPLDWSVEAGKPWAGRSMYVMFYGATNFNQDVSGWDVSGVTNMSFMFYGATAFNNGEAAGSGGNHPLDWSVEAGKPWAGRSMSYMFYGATNFNQDVSGWDVSGVTDMGWMFAYATAFNNGGAAGSHPLDWSVEAGKPWAGRSMYQMFYGATNFNQDVSGWDVSGVTDMSYMFYGATAFNNGGAAGSHPLDWAVEAGKPWAGRSMSQMFASATNFNQDVSSWDVSGVTDMSQMFYDATAFNNGVAAGSGGSHPLDWAVEAGKPWAGRSMNRMFYGATNFNQDVSGWDVSGVTDMSQMFYDATAFNNGVAAGSGGSHPLDWAVEAGKPWAGRSMYRMFRDATNFNQDVSSWDVSGVTDMREMFYRATAFNNGGVSMNKGVNPSVHDSWDWALGLPQGWTSTPGSMFSNAPIGNSNKPRLPGGINW